MNNTNNIKSNNSIGNNNIKSNNSIGNDKNRFKLSS